jgi:hypothetical protein
VGLLKKLRVILSNVPPPVQPNWKREARWEAGSAGPARLFGSRAVV